MRIYEFLFTAVVHIVVHLQKGNFTCLSMDLAAALL